MNNNEYIGFVDIGVNIENYNRPNLLGMVNMLRDILEVLKFIKSMVVVDCDVVFKSSCQQGLCLIVDAYRNGRTFSMRREFTFSELDREKVGHEDILIRFCDEFSRQYKNEKPNGLGKGRLLDNCVTPGSEELHIGGGLLADTTCEEADIFLSVVGISSVGGTLVCKSEFDRLGADAIREAINRPHAEIIVVPDCEFNTMSASEKMTYLQKCLTSVPNGG